jgi:hypothetical protein
MLIKKISGIVLLAIISGCSGQYFEPLSSREIKIQAACTAITWVDWGQTLSFKNYPETEEKNPFLGYNPSDTKINVLVPLGIAAQWVGVWATPKEHRSKVQYAICGAEAYAVINNHSRGVRINP